MPNHYLQAALLGGRWGEPSLESAPRCWKLQHRMKHKPTADKIRAEKVARQNRLYPEWLENSGSYMRMIDHGL
jgi:hypothetical protein